MPALPPPLFDPYTGRRLGAAATAADIAPGEFLPGYGGRPSEPAPLPPGGYGRDPAQGATGGAGYAPPPPMVNGPGADDLISQFLTASGPERAPMPNMGGTITRNTATGPQAYYAAPTPADLPPAAFTQNNLRRAGTPELAKQMLMADRAESALPLSGFMPPPPPGPMGPMDPASRAGQPAADPAQRSADFANDAVRRYVASVRRGGGNGGKIEDFLKDVTDVRATAQALMPAPEPQLGQVMDIAGTPFVRTNPKQITPVPREKDPKVLELDQLLNARDQAVASGRADRVAIYDAAIKKATTASGSGGDPAMAMVNKYFGVDGAPAANALTPAAGSSAAPAKITTRAAYDALPPGTPYIDSKGNAGVKPAARSTTK